MCCHKKGGFRPTVVALHLLILITLGTVCVMKDTRAGKRVMKKVRGVGEKIEEKAEDLLGA